MMKPPVYRYLAFTLLALFLAPDLRAASSTLLGSSNAAKCYEQSQSRFSVAGIVYCHDAILKDELNRRDLAATYSNRGIIYARNRELDRALQDQNKAIELIPGMTEAYINRGNAYFRQRNYDDAIGDYETAIELGRGPIHVAHYNIGLIMLKYKNTLKAKDAFRKALEIAPWSTMIKSKLEQIEETARKP